MLSKQLAWISAAAVVFASTSARGADEVSGPTAVQFSRKGHLLLVQPLSRPALIEKLVKTVDPLELQLREIFVLEAYLAANSSPRRLPRDGFYSDEFATRGATYDDPVNRTLNGVPNVNRDDWQRLRMHLLFNKMLLAEKQPAPQAGVLR